MRIIALERDVLGAVSGPRRSEGAADYVAGGVWGTKKADRYLLDQVRDKVRGGLQSEERTRTMTQEILPEIQATTEALKARIALTETEVAR